MADDNNDVVDMFVVEKGYASVTINQEGAYI